METKLLIIGKGDNIITMILDNLYSTYKLRDIVVYNNLNLPILNPKWMNGLTVGKFKLLYMVILGVWRFEYKLSNIIVMMLSPLPSINKFVSISSFS